MPPSDRIVHLSQHMGLPGTVTATAAAASSAAAAAAATSPALVHMTAQQTYMFDLNGFIVLKGVVPPHIIHAANRAMDEMELRAPPIGTAASVAGDLPPPCVLGTTRTEADLYISNVMEGNLPAFTPFMDVPEVLGVVSDVSMGHFRLNHTCE